MLLIGAGRSGGAIGLGSVATTPEGRGQIIEAAEDFSVSAGLARERAPVVGDHWRGCDDARAAGSAPLYRGEPGYREGLDGDDDGIACEPYHERSEEHTSELQSLMRISYAVFCFKKKKNSEH